MNIDRHDGEDITIPAQAPPKETIRIGSTARLITTIPYLLGFHPPLGSLVVVALRSRSVALLARIDLPHPGRLEDPVVTAEMWSTIVRPLRVNDADNLVLIGYTDSSREEDLYHLHDAAPLPVIELARVMHQRWWSLTCPDQTACTQDACRPWGGQLIDDPSFAAPLIAAGAGLPGTRADLNRILLPGPAELAQAVREHLAAASVPGQTPAFRALTAAHAERIDGPRDIDAETAANLLAGLSHLPVRDACLAWTDEAAWWLWTDLIRAAPDGWIAPVATLISLLAYRRGDGVMAATAAQHALLDRPNYHLAQLVLGCFTIGTTPEAISGFITEAATGLPADLTTGPTQ